MNKINLTIKVTSMVLMLVFVLSPVAVSASTYSADYNSLSLQGKVVYLLGQVAVLQAILEQTEGDSSGGYDYVVVNSSRSNSDDIDVETWSARDIRDDEADLRGQIDLDDEKYATVWFEYGEDDDLDDRTSKKRVYDSRGETQTFTINIDDLDEDEKYYFRAVAEDRDGDREYGKTRTFYTDDDGGSSSNSSGDFELRVSDTRIDEGDEVEVDWEIPSRDEASDNWIGLFETGDDDEDYIRWTYLDDDNEGTVTFRIYDEGDYEFRLFLDNSYREEVTSDEVEVED